LDKHLEPAFGKKPINEISPYTAKELEIYLEAVRSHFPEHFPMFLTLARTGLRLGEALGLQWGDIDFRGKFIEIRRAWVNARLTKTLFSPPFGPPLFLSKKGPHSHPAAGLPSSASVANPA